MESTGRPNTGTTNNRLQQSCIKCRARKIKCDRKNPCSACILRGCEDECEYVRTDEDRYHIGQAKEIENLRKELNRLKRRLEDGGQQPQTQSQPQPYDPALEGSGYSSGAVAERPNKRRIDQDGDVAELWNSIAPTPTVATAYSGSNLFTQPEMSQQSYSITTEQQQQYMYPRHPDPNDNIATNISAHLPQYNLYRIQEHPQPNFWRGKQKQLETIYKIVCDCDEYWVPSIIDIVRTSPSPEDAIVSIRLLLRSGSNSSQSNGYSYSNSNNSNDGGAVLARSTTTTASDSRSPDSASSMVPVEVDYAPYSHDDFALRFGRYLSPTDQSRSSGEG